jgi:hypothetical protein
VISSSISRPQSSPSPRATTRTPARGWPCSSTTTPVTEAHPASASASRALPASSTLPPAVPASALASHW